jgi:hypothetical protein
MSELAWKGAESAIETKAIDGFEIKDADRGEVVAVVSTLNVVDRDGDVVLPGAIKDGSVVKLSAYGHDVITEGKAPVGRGVVTIEGDRAVLKARYFMSTERGRDAFATVKEMGSDSEWSIGFARRVKTAPMTDEWKAKGARRLIAGLDLWESSPVFMGANAMTGTLAAKGAEIEDEPIDPPTEPQAIEEPAVESKAQLVRDLVAELKAARAKVTELETEQANSVAKEIFDRFRRNFKA